MSSMNTSMEEGDSFLSNTDATIYGTSDHSGWEGDSMISDPNIALSSTSTDDLYHQQITIAGGGGGDDSPMSESSSSVGSSSWFVNNDKNNNKKSEIRIFNVDFRALSDQVALPSSSPSRPRTALVPIDKGFIATPFPQISATAMLQRAAIMSAQASNSFVANLYGTTQLAIPSSQLISATALLQQAATIGAVSHVQSTTASLDRTPQLTIPTLRLSATALLQKLATTGSVSHLKSTMAGLDQTAQLCHDTVPKIFGLDNWYRKENLTRDFLRLTGDHHDHDESSSADRNLYKLV